MRRKEPTDVVAQVLGTRIPVARGAQNSEQAQNGEQARTSEIPTLGYLARTRDERG